MTASLPLRVALPAVAVTAALLLAGCGDDSGPTQADDSASAAPTPSGASTSSSGSPDDGTSTSPTGSATPGESSYAVYDVGSTPQGPRLFREFRRLPGMSGAPVAVQALSEQPTDPDYRTLWPAGAFTTASVADGQIDVTVDSALAQRPSGMSAQEARLALQQVVYTMQAAAQQTLPVRFLSGDAPAATVLGVPTADPVAAGDFLDVLALVSVTSPEQGQTVSGGTLQASGVASSYEGTVPWVVLDSSGKKVAHGSAQADGYLDKLYPWKADVDVSGLAPGDYTFVAMTDDPSGGEGGGPTQDTKAFTIA